MSAVCAEQYLLHIYQAEPVLHRQVYVGKARKLLRWQEQELSKRLGLSDAEPLAALEDSLLDPAFAAEVRKRPEVAALASALQRAVGATPNTTLWLHGKSVSACEAPRCVTM